MGEQAIRARLVSRNRRSAGLNVALDESLSAESVQQFLSKADVADSPKQDAAAASSARARLQQRVELDMLYQSQSLQYISAMETILFALVLPPPVLAEFIAPTIFTPVLPPPVHADATAATLLTPVLPLPVFTFRSLPGGPVAGGRCAAVPRRSPSNPSVHLIRRSAV